LLGQVLAALREGRYLDGDLTERYAFRNELEVDLA
jgi:hypothetical protein